MIKAEKTQDDILREEFLRERAVVLGRSGESLQKALEKLHAVETLIVALSENLRAPADAGDLRSIGCAEPTSVRQQVVKEINEQIRHYNRLREYAQLRHYYLIVTREAMGLRRHNWVEKTYPIPPKKKCLEE